MLGRTTFLGALAAAAILPAAAWSGGWATAGVAPPPPGTGAGESWNARITLLQHGRTPLEGVRPSVIIKPGGGGAARTFSAKPTGEPGKYVARVVFPKAGRWTYAVDDGFSARHDFAPVTIGGKSVAPRTAAGRDDGGGVGVWLALGMALAAGTLAALSMLALRRRRPGTETAATTGA